MKKKKFYKKAKTKEVEPQKLPSNSRFIPESIHADHLVFFTGFLCIVLAIIIVSIDLYSNYKEQEIATNEKARIVSELVFWQNEAMKRPGYRDAYFSLALLNYQLEDYDQSFENLKKVLSLDPNFEEGRELESILKSR